MSKLSPELLLSFWKLISRLSPENLHCDGEISKAEAKRRYNDIMEEWKSLEKQAGRPVTQDEVWNAELSRTEKYSLTFRGIKTLRK